MPLIEHHSMEAKTSQPCRNSAQKSYVATKKLTFSLELKIWNLRNPSTMTLKWQDNL